MSANLYRWKAAAEAHRLIEADIRPEKIVFNYIKIKQSAAVPYYGCAHAADSGTADLCIIEGNVRDDD